MFNILIIEPSINENKASLPFTMATTPAEGGHMRDSAKVKSGPRYDHLFHLYNTKSEEEDQDFLADCNDAMDSLLVFVSKLRG
jgi:hypothetical protein